MASKREFIVHTPIGDLRVWAKHPNGDCAEDYPGVYVDLIREDGDILLACVEYDSCDQNLQTCVYGDVHTDSPSEIVQHVTEW